MGGEVIQSFLVGLGFGVDESSLAAFNKAIATAAVRVTALYASIQVASAGIFASVSKISESFEDMGYQYRLIAPAINKAIQLRGALLSAYSAAGINLQKAAQQSVIFNFSLAKTKFALEAIYKSVGLKFIPVLTKQMDVFRKQLYANMPRIQAALEKFVNFILKAFDATTRLGSRVWSILERVYDFFVKLDKATDGWSTVILSVIAAWKLLNLSFLATPLGMLLTGFIALLALWDDFKTFKEGGEALINWGSRTTQIITGIITVIAALSAAILTVIGATRVWAATQALVNTAMALFGVVSAPVALITAAVVALTVALGALAIKMGYLKGLGNSLSGLGGSVLNFMGGASPNVEKNVAALNPGSGTDQKKDPQNSGPVLGPMMNPLGSNVSNKTSTQHVSQETTINVQGSPNANATGSAIAGEQSRVNFDLARNLKGATR